MKESTKAIYKACETAHRAIYNTKWNEKSQQAKDQSKAAHIAKLEALTPETEAARKRIKKTVEAIKAR